MFFSLAFPNGQNAPAGAAQLPARPPVTVGIPPALGLPVFGIGYRRNTPVAAAVHVPEATMDVDNLPQPRQNNVRRARQVPSVHAEPKSHSVNKASN